jgi:hypothetical protein
MMMPPRSMATAGMNDSVWSRRENSIMHDETETKAIICNANKPNIQREDFLPLHGETRFGLERNTSHFNSCY